MKNHSDTEDRVESDPPSQSELTLGLSVLYEVLAISLDSPSKEGMARLCDADATLALMDAARYVDTLLVSNPRPGGPENSNTDLRPAAKSLAQPMAAMLGSFTRFGDDRLDDAFQRLFGHTARGQVVPYETEYGADVQFRQTQELADISGFYEAFGLRTKIDSHQRCDHISAECEFVSFLARKQAYHLDKRDLDSAAAVYHARYLFMQDHLGQFGRAFAVSLRKAAEHPFYKGAAELCELLLVIDCRHLGIEMGARFIPLRSAEDDGVPMACGSCDLHKSAEA